MNALLAKIRALFRKEKLDAEMAEEMRFHLKQRAAENIEDGLAPDEAHFAAQRKFGNVGVIQEVARDERGGHWLEQIRQDLRYAVRQLRRHPAFAAVAVLTLAIGIGANTAMFTLLNAILLRPLPVSRPEQLFVARKIPGDTSFSYASYQRFRDGTPSLAGLAVAQNFVTRRWLLATDAGATEPEPVQAQVVSGNFFSVLGVSAALGRALTPDDDQPNQTQRAVVLSDGFWRRRFGGDPAILGKTVRLDRATLTIVGVMPAGFTGFYAGVQPDLWWPIQLFPQVEPEAAGRPAILAGEGWEWLLLIGRLAPNETLESAQAELGTIYRRELDAFAATRLATWTEKQRRDHFAHMLKLERTASGFAHLRARFASPMTILMIVVGVVLLIACANVAGLLVARAAARQREFAVRSALGAGRGRLICQLVTESLLLALAGGALGLVLARGGTAFLVDYLSVEGANFDLKPDARVLLFTLGASTLTGVLFGLLPAWRASRVELVAAMKQQSAQAGGRSRLNAGLVVAQIALSVALLAGAGLFVRTLRNLRAVDFGFQPAHVTVFDLESARDYGAPQRSILHRRLLDALEAFPSVRSASLANGGLMSGQSLGTRFAIEGYTPAADEEMRAQFMVVGPRFFATLGIPLLRGCEFTAQEASGAPNESARKVVIGESLARRFFGEADPLGRVLHNGPNNAPAFEIIGVAKDTKYRDAREQPRLEYYLPYGPGGPAGRGLSMSFYVRTSGDPAAFAANVRAIIHQADPQLVVSGLRTLGDVVDATLVPERVVAQLGGFFSLFALTLSCLGLYGVLSFGVAQRTREIGVRMALGARAADVLTLIVGQGVKLASLGTLLGVGLALATTRLAEKLLYGVTPGDPLTLLGVAVLLLAVATLAAWLPARRAAKVNPMVALRNE